MVGNLEKRVQKTQDNVNTMKQVTAAWLKSPVFERKDGRKDTLLCLEEKADRIQKRLVRIGCDKILSIRKSDADELVENETM